MAETSPDDPAADVEKPPTGDAGSGASSTPTTGDVDPDSSTPVVPLPAVFRLNPLTYFAVAMMFIAALALSGASLAYLGWTLLLPVLFGIWVARVRTVVTDEGLRVRGTWRTRSIGWDRLEGLQFPRWGSVRAVLDGGERVRLPAIAFRDLPRLSAASRGRIPDPYAAAAAG
ncbi:PH domain-containing protein [Williamsia sterculiae]|nr:PH domain-containing protein [Williamsia sterculiae]